MSGERDEGLGRVGERPVWTDGRLERELVDVLRSREPGSAPLGLRDRVEAIPDEPASDGRGRVLRGVAPLLAAAAILVVAIVAGQALRLSVPLVGPAVSPAPSPTAFDPNLAVPGVAPATETGGYWIVVLLGSALLALAAIAIRDRRRLIPAGAALLLFGWAIVGSYYPVEASVWFTGPRTGLAQAAVPPGLSLTEYYVVAGPGEPFVLGLGLHATPDAPLPIQLDGLVGMPEPVIGPRWTALWLDADQTGDGGARGASEPFAPVDISGRPQAIWIVGRAGQCAVGPSFDQHAPTPGALVMPSLTLRLSVLGWPRTVDLRDPVVAEPDQNGDCARQSGPSPSSSPLGSSSSPSG